MITLEQVEPILTEIVKTNPDRQVTVCQYVNADGDPDCVVGQVMARLGVPLPDYRSEDNTRPFDRLPGKESFSREAVRFLQKAQAIQDETTDSIEEVSVDFPGRPWGDILTELNLT